MTATQRRGFTLIELLIVIAVLGILASIAAPSYRSYVQQATVSQAYGMMQGAKTQVLETLALGAALPANNDEFFSDPAADADIQRIHWYSDGAGARIVADFGPGAGDLEDRRLWLVMDTTSSPSIIQWHCTTHPGASLGIPADALPTECR